MKQFTLIISWHYFDLLCAQQLAMSLFVYKGGEKIIVNL